VNLTKFGAFVSVLPGRDGLLHISKLSALAGGRRVNQVEDVLTLGQAIEVRVDDIDPQGKVSLSLTNVPEGSESGGGADRGDRGGRPDRGDRPDRTGTASVTSGLATASFEDAFEAELVADLGDLGPGAAHPDSGEGRGSGGGDSRRSSRGRSRRR
jgi:polyribonucleotide nucleotidyltransferase